MLLRIALPTKEVGETDRWIHLSRYWSWLSAREKLWLDHYFDLFPFHYSVASVCTVVVVFLAGAGIASLIGLLVVYLRTLPIYLGLFGIGWVAFWGTWASRKIRSIANEIRDAFHLSENEYDRLSSKWLKKLSDSRLHLCISFMFIFGAWLYLGLATRLWLLPWFPQAWSLGPHLWAKNLILGMYAVPILLLLITTGVGIIIFAAFVSALSKCPLVPSLEIVRVKLRPITDFGLITGLAWSVGVSLFVLLFRPEFSVPAVVAVALLTLLGLTMIFWPQYALHKAMNRTRSDLLRTASAMLLQEISPAQIADREDYLKRMLDPRAQQIEAFIRSVTATRTWIYNVRDVATVAAQWLLPLASLGVTLLIPRSP